jgi:hypothetical protein
MKWIYHDGGRAAAGFSGDTGDCVTRAIAIATDQPYLDVYAVLADMRADYATTSRSRQARRIINGRGPVRSAANGIPKPVIREYMGLINWRWVPTMGIGTGCTVHMRAADLPPGRLIVSVTRHLAAVIDGVLYDTHDCTRAGTRCVYGYWLPPGA